MPSKAVFWLCMCALSPLILETAMSVPETRINTDGSSDPLISENYNHNTISAAEPSECQGPQIRSRSLPRVDSMVTLEQLQKDYFARSMPVVIKIANLRSHFPSLIRWFENHVAELRGKPPPPEPDYSNTRISVKVADAELLRANSRWEALTGHLPWIAGARSLLFADAWGGDSGNTDRYLGGISLHDDEVCHYMIAIHMGGAKKWQIQAGPPALSRDSQYFDTLRAGDVLLWPQYLPHGVEIAEGGWSLNFPFRDRDSNGSNLQFFGGTLPDRCQNFSYG